jgi:hypothetical protein
MWTFMADLGAGERRWKAEVIAHKAADSRSIAEPMVHGLLKELHSAQVVSLSAQFADIPRRL